MSCIEKRRNTNQQRITYDSLTALDCHASADQVYEHLHQKHPTISKATVYRNLQQLANMGKILHIGVFSGAAHYDHNTHPHYHFECEHCKRIFDTDGYLENISQHVAAPDGFDVRWHDIHFHGTCHDCKNSA